MIAQTFVALPFLVISLEGRSARPAPTTRPRPDTWGPAPPACSGG
ncbi:hypothetical protein [Tessaracoccus coleopterorum]|nr:hypothetical protein [Tessaracoccus coleopterorum]